MILRARYNSRTIEVMSDPMGTAELCDLDINIEGLEKPIFYFNRIKVKNEGQGIGKELMIEVCKIADRENITIINELNPYGKRNLESLKQFFKASGFEDFKNKQTSQNTMVRKPKRI